MIVIDSSMSGSKYLWEDNEEETKKGVWDTLKKYYGGDDKPNKAKHQALIYYYKMLRMNE